MSAPASPLRLGVALVFGVVAIGVAAPLFKLSAPTHPLIASATRLELAALIQAPWLLMGLMRGTFSFRTHGRAAVYGGLCYAVHFGAWVWSLGLTSITSSVTLVCATPLALAAWSWLTGRDRPTRRHVVSLAIACVGIGLIGWHDAAPGGAGAAQQGALLGDALALVGAASMVGYLLMVREQGDTLDVLAFSSVVCASGALMLHAVALALGVDAALPTWQAAWVLLLVAVLPQVFGHGLLTWALRHTSPTVVAIAVLGEPPAAIALGRWWLGEPVAPVAILGCALTLVAVGLTITAPGPSLARPDDDA